MSKPSDKAMRLAALIDDTILGGINKHPELLHAEMAELIDVHTAEAYEAGQEAMRERAAKLCNDEAMLCDRTEMGNFRRMVCNARADGIRVLPIQPLKTEGDK